MRRVLFELTLDDPTSGADDEDEWIWQILGPSDAHPEHSPWQLLFYSNDTGEVRFDACVGLRELGRALVDPSKLGKP